MTKEAKKEVMVKPKVIYKSRYVPGWWKPAKEETKAKTKEWYLNKEFVDKLKREFEKAGLPLEYRAKKILEDYGFEASEFHYKYPEDHTFDIDIDCKEGVWRQIDISALPNHSCFDFDLKFGEFRLILTPHIIGECKFSSNKSFFLFRSESQHIKNFPSIIWGDCLLPFKLWLHDPDDESLTSTCLEKSTKYFSLDVYENVVEVDLEHLGKDNNFNDQTTYRACEQLYNAVNYHLYGSKPELQQDEYIEICKSMLFQKWLLYLENNNITKEDAIPFGNKISDSIALKFLKNNFDLNDIQNISHCIICNFPIFIINEDAGLYEIIFDKKRNIQNFNKIKFGLYNYHAPECHNNNHCLYPDSLGIIICDVSYLNELIELIVISIQKLGKKLEKNLDKWPYLLGYELLFNPELIDPNNYFSD